MLDRGLMHQYQNDDVEFIKETPYCALWRDMGLGKTVTSATAVCDLMMEFDVGRTLIVAPKRVAVTTWPMELQNWKHLCRLRYEVISGSKKERVRAIMRKADVHIISRDNLSWLVQTVGKQWPWDCVILDESSSFKSQSSNRWKAMRAARRMCERVIQLSATPAPQGMQDLWAQVYLLDLGERLGATEKAFTQRWFHHDPQKYLTVPKPHAEAEIHEMVSDIANSRRAEDYLNMPELIANPVYVDLPPAAEKQYRKFEREMLLQLEEVDAEVEAANAAVLVNKLLQLCISEGTEVLCRRGWVPIEEVVAGDEVWDGVEFVSTKGCVFNGVKPVVDCYGVAMTPDHKVLTEKGWLKAEEIINGNAFEGFDRAEVRLPGGSVSGGSSQEQSGDVAVQVRLREGSGSSKHIVEVQKQGSQEVVRVSSRGNDSGRNWWPRHDRQTSLEYLAKYAKQVSQSKRQGLQKLRRSWDHCSRQLVRLVQRFLGGRAGWLSGRFNFGSSRQQQGVLETELSLDFGESPIEEHSGECFHQHSLGPHDDRGSCGTIWDKVRDHSRQVEPLRMVGGATTGPSEKEVNVYDLIDCGPRHRFVVRGSDGPLIVHNCNGAMYYDEARNYSVVHDEKIEALKEIVEAHAGYPILCAYNFKSDLARLRKAFPQAVMMDDDPETQNRWNRGEIPMLLTHPASSGHGLNLQRGSNIIVWFGLNWSLELYKQLVGRLYRQRQTESTVVVHHIMARGTADERVFQVIKDKNATQLALLDAVKLST